jgi:hypothetical protein
MEPADRMIHIRDGVRPAIIMAAGRGHDARQERSNGATMSSQRTLGIYVGWDSREADAYHVCDWSIGRRASAPVDIHPIYLRDLQKAGLYTRATEIRDGRLWDVVSEAPMSTEFAVSRFFVPMLARRDGVAGPWVVFCDCDFLWLADPNEILAQADDTKAVMCVQHRHEPDERTKMDGQLQLLYARKNWSSLILFNLAHPANAALDLDMLNTVPGRDLHRFCWLKDSEIGALPETWNWLEGWSPKGEAPPKAIHYTRGGPWMSGWEEVQYADLWLAEFGAMTLDRRRTARVERTTDG